MNNISQKQSLNKTEKLRDAYIRVRKNPIRGIIMNMLVVFIAFLILFWNLFPITTVILVGLIAGIFIGPSIYLFLMLYYKVILTIVERNETNS
jgi:hypothetical protein